MIYPTNTYTFIIQQAYINHSRYDLQTIH